MAKKGFNKKLLFIPLAVLLVGGMFVIFNSLEDPLNPKEKILELDESNFIEMSFSDPRWVSECRGGQFRGDYLLFMDYEFESTIEEEHGVVCELEFTSKQTGAKLFLTRGFEINKEINPKFGFRSIADEDNIFINQDYTVKILSCEAEYNNKRINVITETTNLQFNRVSEEDLCSD